MSYRRLRCPAVQVKFWVVFFGGWCLILGTPNKATTHMKTPELLPGQFGHNTTHRKLSRGSSNMSSKLGFMGMAGYFKFLNRKQ